MSARLNLNPIPYFPWKGRTFNNITTTIQRNINTNVNELNIFKALPLQIYRKELTTAPKVNSRRVSIDELDQSIKSKACTLVVVDINYNENKSAHPSCDTCFISDEQNALKRVRSAGMIRKKDSSKHQNYYTSSSQYLNSRSKTFNQNQFNYLKNGNATVDPGSAAASQNTYSANGVSQVLDTACSSVVYYKPNNSQFAQQGAVSSSDLITRVKYNTITNNGAAYRNAYGAEVANALAYGVPDGGYTIKNKIGFPANMTPKITPHGVECCLSTKIH